jgi:hypothetical protein
MFPAAAISRERGRSYRPDDARIVERRPVMDLRFQTLPAILLKIVLRLLPSKLHAAMQTTATRAAINPYSMAVTPASSNINWKMIPRILILLLELHRGQGGVKSLMKA